jgi:hypothetical protein
LLIDLVCHVVDNYGDIAVTWRLAQALIQDGPANLRVRLLVDDWDSFRSLLPELGAGDRQVVPCPGGQVTVLRSTALDRLQHERLTAADVLVEAFGAPTPVAWVERFLAAAETTLSELRHRVMIHLEYLTAEAWSEQYHRLPSPVGRPGVERYFFVPGFRDAAGGLVFTDPAPVPAPRGGEDWAMTLFSYEHDFTPFWEELADFLTERGQTARVLVCAGRSQAGALAGWQRVAERRGPLPITVEPLPFLEQSAYTALLASGDFHVVRGEESWVQAVLSGKPFLWQAYLQPEGHQSVKAEAFLEVWRPWFAAEGEAALAVFERVADQFRAMNRRLTNTDTAPLGESYRVFWENRELLENVGARWAEHLRKNAKLSRRMLEFLETFRV